MSELEDAINSLLSDPETFGKISSMARSIMGEEAPPASVHGEEPPSAEPDGEMMRRAMRLLSGMKTGGSRSSAVLESIKPYLTQQRRERVSRAMEIARLAHLAETALAEYGGGNDGGKQI